MIDEAEYENYKEAVDECLERIYQRLDALEKKVKT
jgi:hypothetical protein